MGQGFGRCQPPLVEALVEGRGETCVRVSEDEWDLGWVGRSSVEGGVPGPRESYQTSAPCPRTHAHIDTFTHA